MHDYVFDRREDIHRSGAFVLRLETDDLAGELVQIEAAHWVGYRAAGLAFARPRSAAKNAGLAFHLIGAAAVADHTRP